MPPLDSFCDFCKNLFCRNKGKLPVYKSRYTIDRSIDRSQLSQSLSYCALCRLTCNLLRRYRGHPETPRRARYTFYINCRTGALVIFDITIDLEDFTDKFPHKFLLTLSPSNGEPIEDDGNYPAASLSTSGNDNTGVPWSWLKSCMSECRNNHRACNLHVQDRRLPTRLIDVGTQTTARPRLVMTGTLPQSACEKITYIALSHKWGTRKFTVLTSQNIDAFEACLPLEELPKTFQDAIHFTRQFDIRYLWIDSLCILQDSSEDWQAEAPVMHSVYSNSCLNIAASESESPSEGLYPRKYAYLEQPIQFCHEHGDSRDPINCHYEPWDDIDGFVPLSQRGWVLQERLASPRTIHFMSTVLWECRESRASRISPAFSAVYSEKIWQGQSINNDRDAAFAWYRTIETYSKCALTKRDDKLVAISGLAKIMQTFTRSDYLAGMWRADLARSLLWVPYEDAASHGSRRPRVVEQQAPSWSWASVDGPIQMIYAHQFHNLVVDIIEAETRPLYSDLFSNIASGHLALRGRIYLLGIFSEVWSQFKDANLIHQPFDFGLDGHGEHTEEDENVYLLPIASLMLYSQLYFFSLLLQQDSMRDGTLAYRRIGFFVVQEVGIVGSSKYWVPHWTPPSTGSSLNEEIVLV